MTGYTSFTEKKSFKDPAVLDVLKIEQTEKIKLDFEATAFDANTSTKLVSLPPSYSQVSGWKNNNSDIKKTQDELRMSDELERKQKELELKAAELQKREEELQRNVRTQAQRNNFPLLPSFCPFQPCFYQDISMDISSQFQKFVFMGYYIWIAYIGLMNLNLLGSVLFFGVSVSNGYNNQSGTTFALSIFLLLLFIPCSFICWFRPLYKAFRSDSSINFFIFFFIFFFQCLVSIFQSLGIDGWGTVGILSSLSMLSKATAGSIFVGVIMMLIGLAFASISILDFFLLFKVHRIYRSTGASFAKAQTEFAGGVMSNKTVQRAVSNMVTSATTSNTEQFGDQRPNAYRY